MGFIREVFAMSTKHTVTGDDGTKYELQHDGTLKEVESDGDKPPKTSTDGGRGDRPLTWSEQRDQSTTIEATREVPEELRRLWSDLSVSRPIAVTTIERGADDRPGSTSGHRPLWVGSVLKPRPAPRLSRPRVRHRGVALDPLVVWGADERRIYHDARYPWGCVCRVLGRGIGSGVLVGPRHVLTASHVVDWNAGATIEVHRAGGTVAATAQAVKGYAYTRITENDYTTLDEDYAVLVTEERLGDRFGWMGTRTYDSDWDDEDYWYSIGYPTDIEGGLFPVWQNEQNLDEDEWDYGSARAMTTSADLTEGQSGSPMFGFWGDIPYVVAVVAASGEVFASGTENWCSGGSDLTRMVNQARADDP
jgi:V8-like Glu-specific endopeptidase